LYLFRYLGKSTEKVVFIFKDTTYNVGVNIDVTDSRIIIPINTGFYSRREIDMQYVLLLILFEKHTFVKFIVYLYLLLQKVARIAK